MCLRYDIILWAAIDSNVRGITIRRKHRNTTGVSQLRCLFETFTMDKEVRRIKQGLGITFSELIYNGETLPHGS